MTAKPGQLGSVVTMTRGRETDHIYVIIAKDSERYVFVADGRKRTVARPKRKNARHLRVITSVDPELAMLLRDGVPIRDEHLRAVIKRVMEELYKSKRRLS